MYAKLVIMREAQMTLRGYSVARSDNKTKEKITSNYFCFLKK